SADHLEPPNLANRLRSPVDGSLDRILDTNGRTADDFHNLVDMVAHGGSPSIPNPVVAWLFRLCVDGCARTKLRPDFGPTMLATSHRTAWRRTMEKDSKARSRPPHPRRKAEDCPAGLGEPD